MSKLNMLERYVGELKIELMEVAEQALGEKVSLSEIFICVPNNPYTESIKENYRVTYHAFSKDGVCEVCGTNVNDNADERITS